jgi:hypothetical protein
MIFSIVATLYFSCSLIVVAMNWSYIQETIRETDPYKYRVGMIAIGIVVLSGPYTMICDIRAKIKNAWRFYKLKKMVLAEMKKMGMELVD